MIIALDGPAASGKGTLARRIAAHHGLSHLDTGLLYRATARALIDAGERLDDEARAVAAARGLALTDFDEDKLRGREMGEAASIVAAIPAVRASLLDMQRAFAARPGGAVLDGRDIGTVICPEADAKLFVTASPEERAKRRWLELKTTNPELAYDTVLADIRRRDERAAQHRQRLAPEVQLSNGAQRRLQHGDEKPLSSTAPLRRRPRRARACRASTRISLYR